MDYVATVAANCEFLFSTSLLCSYVTHVNITKERGRTWRWCWHWIRWTGHGGESRYMIFTINENIFYSFISTLVFSEHRIVTKVMGLKVKLGLGTGLLRCFSRFVASVKCLGVGSKWGKCPRARCCCCCCCANSWPQFVNDACSAAVASPNFLLAANSSLARPHSAPEAQPQTHFADLELG